MSKCMTARPSAPVLWSVALVALALALFQALPAGADAVSGKLAYEHGRYDEALANWRPAAERGDAEAQFSLAVMYYEGKGVETDWVQAYVWFARAYANGYKLAGQMVSVLARRLGADQLQHAQQLLQSKS